MATRVILRPAAEESLFQRDPSLRLGGQVVRGLAWKHSDSIHHYPKNSTSKMSNNSKLILKALRAAVSTIGLFHIPGELLPPVTSPATER